MKLASKVAKDSYNGDNIDYLLLDKSLSEQTNICSQSNKNFCEELHEYLKDNDLFSNKEGGDRVTRSSPFTIEDAKIASDMYSDILWKAIKKRLDYTDMSQSSCAYTEAPAEGIFSVYSKVSSGRTSATIDHLVALTRVSAHGPPIATADAASLSEEALKNFQSQYGARFCTRTWKDDSTSSTITKLQDKKWDW